MTDVTGWIRLDSSKLNLRRKRTLRGVEVTVFASLFDVPDTVRRSFDPKTNRHLVEFRYLDDEVWRKTAKGDNVILRIGRFSRRLLGIEFDGKAMEIADDGLPAPISEALRQLAQEPGMDKKKIHYGMAEKVLADPRNGLFADLVPCSP